MRQCCSFPFGCCWGFVEFSWCFCFRGVVWVMVVVSVLWCFMVIWWMRWGDDDDDDDDDGDDDGDDDCDYVVLYGDVCIYIYTYSYTPSFIWFYIVPRMNVFLIFHGDKSQQVLYRSSYIFTPLLCLQGVRWWFAILHTQSQPGLRAARPRKHSNASNASRANRLKEIYLY